MNPFLRDNPVIRELEPGETQLAFPALRTLRTDVEGPDAFVKRVDQELRPVGYRLVGAFVKGNADAVSVAGFRLVRNLAWGDHLFLDDLSTVASARRYGYAEALLEWLATEAKNLDLPQLHLDSAHGPERTHAHRLYFKAGFRIAAHHFARDGATPP